MSPSRRSEVPTIADLKEIQRRCNLFTVHVVWLGEHGFVIAHTNDERAAVGPGFDLDQCSLHEWLSGDCYDVPDEVGYYVVTPHEVDLYSESYPVRRFDYTPLDLSTMGPEAVLR